MAMTARRWRMVWVSSVIATAALAVFLILTAFQKNLLYFYTPSQVAAGEVQPGYTFRVGGMVENGSFVREEDGLTVRFVLSDGAHTVPVRYRGILPDLFREGQGIIAIGKLDGERFEASEVLAKHDENYMPPEVAAALQQAGGLKPRDFYQGKTP